MLYAEAASGEFNLVKKRTTVRQDGRGRLGAGRQEAAVWFVAASVTTSRKTQGFSHNFLTISEVQFSHL